jgi:hypothetical protein
MANSYSDSHSSLLQNKTKIDTGALPQLNPEGKLNVIRDIELKTGDIAQLCKLGPQQMHAVMDLQKDHQNDPKYKGKEFTLVRSKEDYLKMTLLGLVINNRLAAIAGISLVKDQDDLGRSKPSDNQSDYSFDSLQMMKSIICHPSIEDYHLGIRDIFYADRICEGAKHPDRPCLMMNSNNPVIQKFFKEKNWKILKSSRLEEADEPWSQMKENEKDLVTYYIMLDDALDGVEKEWPDIFAMHAAEITAAQQNVMRQSSKENLPVNDNFTFAPKQDCIPR